MRKRPGEMIPAELVDVPGSEPIPAKLVTDSVEVRALPENHVTLDVRNALDRLKALYEQSDQETSPQDFFAEHLLDYSAIARADQAQRETFKNLFAAELANDSAFSE